MQLRTGGARLGTEPLPRSLLDICVPCKFAAPRVEFAETTRREVSTVERYSFATRTRAIKRSFIREILKVTEEPDVISFAGGLPNPSLFPVQEFSAAAAKVLAAEGERALQYSTTEGFPPLREFIAKRYRERKGLAVQASSILITNGSQQGLDLLGKIFLDPGDLVLIERPAYLGAIQAFALYEPEFHTVLLEEDGPDLESLAEELATGGRGPKLFYTVPNFQNPSGISYGRDKRAAVGRLLAGSDTVAVEDDPYGELRFLGEDLPMLAGSLGDRAVLLGSFSKIVAPGIRLGWVCAPEAVMQRLVTAKQGSDLHSNYFSQRVLYQYLCDNDLDAHIGRIRAAYGAQREAMVKMLELHCPPEVRWTRPEGGMFLWLTLPERLDAMELFERAIKERVAFVPGAPFYVDGGGSTTLRLNFSNSDLARIETGIIRLSKAMKELLAGSSARAVGADLPG